MKARGEIGRLLRFGPLRRHRLARGRLVDPQWRHTLLPARARRHMRQFLRRPLVANKCKHLLAREYAPELHAGPLRVASLPGLVHPVHFGQRFLGQPLKFCTTLVIRFHHPHRRVCPTRSLYRTCACSISTLLLSLVGTTAYLLHRPHTDAGQDNALHYFSLHYSSVKAGQQ